jgi:hypothetical protein
LTGYGHIHVDIQAFVAVIALGTVGLAAILRRSGDWRAAGGGGGILITGVGSGG